MKSTTVVTVVLLLVMTASRAQEALPRYGSISGVVSYPDGHPAAGAEVKAVTACLGEGFHLVQEVTTSDDGEFNVPPFKGWNCNRVQLSARKDLWLPTGEGTFYGKQIGTAPLVELAEEGSSQRTQIQLGEQGGTVEFRVWDTATQRFIWARLSLNRVPVPDAKFGSMTIATGRDGSPDTVLLPAGMYEVSVEAFACKDQDYIAAKPVREMLEVPPGTKGRKDISLDVSRIKPRKAYSNPRGAYCMLDAPNER